MRRIEPSFVAGGRGFANGAFLALVLVLTSGCALFGGADPGPQFTTVTIMTRGQSDMDLEADSTLKSALIGGGAGGASGAVIGAGVGAGIGAAGGGPFAPVAAVIGAGVFGGIGLVGGATTGVVIGGFQGLPGEKAEQVTQVLSDLAQIRDFQEELRSAVEATVPADRRAAANQADATAILELTQLELEQHLSDEISLRIRAKMTLEWGPNIEDRDSLSTDYEYETPDRHVDDWLLDDGAAFGAGFTEGMDAIADQMSRDIFFPEPQ
jgi:hypothetical protein